ncbi:MAG: protein kinase [Acidobacteriota bacterium]
MTQTVPTGQLVADRFLIVRFIAAGGMGEVYEAEDKVLGDRVALKFLSRRSIGDERVMRRFRREIQLARKVTHRNVCRLHDLYQHTPTEGLFEGRETTFVTMELLQGDTLEDTLQRQGPMTAEEALPLIVQMTEALTAAHTAGIIHRDFKTSNVMLVPDTTDDGPLRAVVTDFGLARLATPSPEDTRTPLTGEMRIVGTADYMSPEQLYGEELSPASDVYSLGVVLFEMMTGQRPYSAPNPMSLLAKRVSEPPASPSQFAPDLDPHWERVILECLANDPRERLATAREVAVALLGDEYFTQPSGTVTPPTDWIREAPRASSPDLAPPAKRRNPWPLALGLLLVVLAAGALWLRLAERSPPSPLANFNPVQLTTSAGLELDPTFSPDGNALAYTSDRAGAFEIMVRDLSAGGREVQLTSDGANNFEPAWSPDGKTLIYHSKGLGGIWQIAADGGAPQRVTQFGSRPAWSPDGTLIAFQSESSPLLSDTTSPALSLSTLWLVRKDGSGRRQLTRSGKPHGGHANPAFSPDGRRIVFSASPQRGATEIWIIDLATEALHQITTEAQAGYDPTFAPDGHSIYFSSRAREVNALWQVPVSVKTGQPDGEAVQIANLGLASIRQVATSPDGAKMAYTAMKTVSNLWSMPIDPATGVTAGSPYALTQGSGRNNRPVFSNDGQLVAFDRWQHGFNVAVWRMREDGSEAQQVTVDPWKTTQPSWLDNERLAYLSLNDGKRSLWSIELDSENNKMLTDLDEDVDWVKLSPDGTRLAFHSRSTELGVNLWVMTLADGKRRQLTFGAEFMGFPCWSQDSEWLAFQSKTGDESHLMVMPAAGGEPLQLTSEGGQNWPFSFSPDGDKVAFAALRDGEWNLWWVSRTTGREHRLTESPRLNAYVRYPAWSPKGHQIVYELAETTGDIWLVEEVE